MRIAVDTRTLLDKVRSGVPEYTYNLLSALLTLDQENQYTLYRNAWRAKPAPEFPFKNVRQVSTRYPNKLFNYFLQSVCHYPKLDLICSDPAAQTAGGVQVYFAPHLNFYSFSPKVRSVLTIHDLSFLRCPEFFSRRKNLWHRALRVGSLVKKFDALVAVSENTKQDLVEILGVPEEKIKVIYSGLSDEFRRLEPDRPEAAAIKQKYRLPDKFILYLGTLEPRKNLVGLIEAYDLMLKKAPELAEHRLVIAGGAGWLADEIFAARDAAKNRQSIIFTGYIPIDERVELYNLATFFVFPSFYEGFGFPPLEAMACGLPVVASAASSLPEVTGQAAVLVDPYDQNDLARAMARILTDRTLAEKLRTAGYEQTKKFHWQKAASEYLELFRSLVN